MGLRLAPVTSTSKRQGLFLLPACQTRAVMSYTAAAALSPFPCPPPASLDSTAGPFSAPAPPLPSVAVKSRNGVRQYHDGKSDHRHMREKPPKGLKTAHQPALFKPTAYLPTTLTKEAKRETRSLHITDTPYTNRHTLSLSLTSRPMMSVLPLQHRRQGSRWRFRGSRTPFPLPLSSFTFLSPFPLSRVSPECSDPPRHHIHVTLTHSLITRSLS
ncbi:hypothetical protein QBC39DRAFT_151601 [Podospora conica]|nr:hypothetical protein QBC39DRAFT_151601 [Schizothecium conicum]